MQEILLATDGGLLKTAMPITGDGEFLINQNGLYVFDSAPDFELEVFGASGGGGDLNTGFRYATGGVGGRGGYRMHVLSTDGRKYYMLFELAPSTRGNAANTTYNLNGQGFTIIGGGVGQLGDNQNGRTGYPGTAGTPADPKGLAGGAGGTGTASNLNKRYGKAGQAAKAVVRWTVPEEQA